MSQHATGTFEVTVTPQEAAGAPPGGPPTARFSLEKRFVGGLQGGAQGSMLSLGAPQPGSAAAYVALDLFEGTLDGRRGGFVLVHRGMMSKSGGRELEVRIATDSGTGELSGITGSLRIDLRDGKHCYDLSYQLP